MNAWTPVPEPVTWRFPKPLAQGGLSYATVTLGAPTAEDILKATSVRGASGMDITLRLIESASAEHVPYEVLKRLPSWLIQPISDSTEAFAGAPAPDPLEAWRAARRLTGAGRSRESAGFLIAFARSASWKSWPPGSGASTATGFAGRCHCRCRRCRRCRRGCAGTA